MAVQFNIRISLVIHICLVAKLLAQELPPIQNYSPETYGGGNQNWSISQAKNRIVYFANNEGLIEYNGARWTLYDSPNQTILRSVQVIDDRIYTGAYMDFGYWMKNAGGVLLYHSISKHNRIDLLEDEEFWNIIEINEWVVFQSLKRIYIYKPADQSIRTIDSEHPITKIFKTENNAIYFQRLDKGIYQIKNGKDTLILSNPEVAKDEVIAIMEERNELTLLTKKSGFYTYAEDRLVRYDSWLDPYPNLEVYSATKLSDSRVAIGTIANGIIILDANLRQALEIKQENGLINNTILSLFEDQEKNLWIGSDNGISNIGLNAPILVYEDKNGTLGSIYATAIYDEKLFIGTNQGLFFKSIKSNSNRFTFVENTEGQVWSLLVDEKGLFISHHDGTFLFNHNELNKIADKTGTWTVAPIDERTLLQGSYDGLYKLTKLSGSWQAYKIKDFDISARYFVQNGNTVFVNHEYKGLFRLELDAAFKKVESITVDSTLKSPNSGLVRYQNHILFAGKRGIFKLQESTNTFHFDSLYSRAYQPEDYVSGRMTYIKENEELWVFTKQNMVKITSGNLSKTPKIHTIPLSLSRRGSVVEFENIILFENPSIYLIGTNSGYFILNNNKLSVDKEKVYISSISNGINPDHSVSNTYITLNEKGVFRNTENNLNINFFTPVFNNLFPSLYQYQLRGKYEEWSDWSDQTSIFYENIPPGDYTFNVRSKVGNDVSPNIASYSFKVLKPWYFRDFMIFIYILGVLLFSIFMHYNYRFYYKSQQKKIIGQKQKELELVKLKKEQELIKLRNDQLEKENKDKSNELAASTMGIIKKNELLTQIKHQLLEIGKNEALRPVIKIIDKNLNHKENWEMFKEAFEMVDGDFFKNLKDKHPNLSPNDLKLCAYLRLNLSSKEIAQLINISPKSVEVKRYRLRKKLALATNKNLTNYILNM